MNIRYPIYEGVYRILTNIGDYLIPYFFIFRYSVEEFTFNNRAVCSRCPLHA